MTNEQAKNMLKAKLECLKRETSGNFFDCNNSNCDECSLRYEQGNMGEQKEALDMAIKALEQEPYEDCISRQTAIEVAKQYWYKPDIARALAERPSVTLQPNTGHWIPCSERLPKKEEKTYWVCTDTEYQCECRWTNNRFGLGEGEWGWSIFDTPQYSKPIAWMPLPKPYREVEE